MSKISCGISPRVSVDLQDYSPSGLREFMVASIDTFLRQIPGNSINEKLPAVARALGFREGRVNEYRHRKINRPYADEVWAVLNHAERVVAGNAQRAELRRNNEELIQAARQTSLIRISGADAAERADSQACGRASGNIGQVPSSLGRFAGGILSVEEIGLDGASHSHQKLAEAANQTSGEFTVALSYELARLGLADLAWLYGAKESLPTRHIGVGIKILSAEDRALSLNRPIEDQPLPPAILSVVSGHLRACMREKARPAVHRIKASIVGGIHTYDRLSLHFPVSGLIMGSCVMVAA